MRAWLIYFLFFVVARAEAQGNWCGAGDPVVPGEGDVRYQQFLSLLQDAGNIPVVETRSEQYFQVVVHLVAPDGYQPLSEAQVLQQLDVLNQDFAGKGNNLPVLLPEFLPLVGDAGIQFCLARIDPEGQPTTGITFTHTTVDNIALQTGEGGRIAIHYDQLGGKTGWDPLTYINIWVGEYGGIYGSASFPGMAPYPEEIGLVVNVKNFGSIGDAGLSGNYGRGHTLTHEMGHFFNLKHVWGEGEETDCEDGDDVEDTPNAAGPYFDCPSGVQVSCESSNMYQNFMDLTDDRCLAAFTKGQVNRIHAAAEVYYASLVQSGPCGPSENSFSQWYDQLTWALDEGSAKYVVYNTEGWAGHKTIEVFSMDGKRILEDSWTDQYSYLVDLNQVSAGVYVVRISDGEHYNARKIVVYR